MNFARSPFRNIVPIVRVTSSSSSASVTFWRWSPSAISRSASRPMKSWSNLT